MTESILDSQKSSSDSIWLDCTLRDGGYYNDWMFSDELVHRYLKAMTALGVDYVELGFRSFQAGSFKGACAYTTDTYIRNLNVPDELSLGVMINAQDIIQAPLENDDAVRKLFDAAKESPVSLVRVASHFQDVAASVGICQTLKKLGYTVGLNVMQIADRSLDEIAAATKTIDESAVDVLYFADSMGSLTPSDVTAIVSTLKGSWSGPLGIHTHDNMGLAMANSIAAIDSGVRWVDSTVTGMGRGPGNVCTEYLAIEMAERYSRQINMTPLAELVRSDFGPMKQAYGWGTNIYYYLAGRHGIHPTYIQEMVSDARYTDSDIFAAIAHLKAAGGKKFKADQLRASRNFFAGTVCGSCRPREIAGGRDILIVGPGEGTREYAQYLEQHIRINKPYVIALNAQPTIDDSLIDLKAACHPVRLYAEAEEHLRFRQPLLTPFSMLPDDLKELLSEKEILDYGIEIASGEVQARENHCRLPVALVAGYAIAFSIAAGANTIQLAGFDGYRIDDPRYREMDELLAALAASQDAPELFAITPSRYRVPARSVFLFL